MGMISIPKYGSPSSEERFETMKIRGVQIRFDCKNGEQFEAIGRFWDRMHVFCPGENLLGVGFGWKNDTLCYLIGTDSRWKVMLSLPQ